MFINLVNLSSAIIKDAFAHIRGNIGELTNHRRETVSREMICSLLSRSDYLTPPSSSFHSSPLSPCHSSPHYGPPHIPCHLSPLFYECITTTIMPYLSYLCLSSPHLYVYHHLGIITIVIGEQKQILKRAALSACWRFMINKKE